jgi:site-specific DNA recombinase
MKTVGYVRVSTDTQAEKGKSIDNQIERIKNYCKDKKLILEKIFIDEGYSGKNTNRPGFQDMFEAIRSGKYQALVVWHSNRFARNLRDYLNCLDELEKSKVKFYSIEEPNISGSSGKAMRNLMGVFAEYQSDITGEHTRSVKSTLKKNKKVYCPYPPLGFKNEEGQLVRDPNTYEIVSQIFVYREQGMSMHTIAKTLNMKDIKGHKGGKFYASTIQKVLNNPIYLN